MLTNNPESGSVTSNASSNSTQSAVGKKEIFTIALGSVIGWGAFMLPGNVFLPNYGVLNTLVGFVIAIIMLLFIEKSYTTTMEKVPKAGGEYSFARDLLGKKSGFITGWGLLLAYISIIPLNATAVPMVLDKVFPFYSQGVLLYEFAGYPVYLNDILVSLSILAFFTYINIRGVKGALLAQNICVFALLGALALITVFSTGTFFSSGGEIQTQNFVSNWGELDTNSIVRIIAFAPWAFIGFDAVAQMSGDHKIKPKSVSLITVIAIIIGAVIYNYLNIVTAMGINKADLNGSSWATGDAVRALVGDGLFYLLALAMFGAVISGLNGFFVSSTRLVVSMAEDFKFSPNSIDKNNTDTAETTIEKTESGHVIIPQWIFYFIGGCSMVVPFFGRTALLWFVDLSSVGASVAYFVVCLCAYQIAKKDDNVNKSKNKIISIMGMLVSLAFLVFLLTPIFESNISTPSYYSLAFWIVLGFIVYAKVGKNSIDKNCND